MKNTMKKFLSFVLAVIMIVCTVPIAFAEGNTYKVGDVVSFGSYPQSKVTDEAVISSLNSKAPAWEDWTSYGYYSGDGYDFSMEQGDWMRYVDIKHEGKKYRGVKFVQYRPNTTEDTPMSTYQDDNGYSTNTVYWFKFESIDWRVLDPIIGLVMCETIIDSQPYSNTMYYNHSGGNYFNDATYKNYASDYETSSIRKWLNEDFYNIAFTDSEKKEINITTLNNDGYYTSKGITGHEKLDSNETTDKIFLLSYNEVRNSSFGFNSSSSPGDMGRLAQGSDYAQSQGLYVCRDSGSTDIYNGKSYWLLRSPGIYSSFSCCVTYYGDSERLPPVTDANYGVRPALKIDLNADVVQPGHKHNHSAVVTNPTCRYQGYTTYTCECGDSYIDDYVNTFSHKDDNKDYKCDYGCGYAFEKPANPTPEDPTKDCSCNCHKGGIAGLFFKIINFFQKLFGQNKVCACGLKH